MIAAFIPARSGSKGFKDKNIAKFRDRTLLEIAISQAIGSKLIDEVFVCTDSPVYETIAINAGAKSFGLRPKHLSCDTSKTINVIDYHITNRNLKNFTHIALIQPTSPIRPSKLIDRCIGLAISSNESCVTVSSIDEPHPMKALSIEQQSLVPFIDGADTEAPRQSYRKAFCLTGSVYVSSIENIIQKKSFFSSKTQPVIQETFVNIDSKRDLDFLVFLDSIMELEIDN